MNQLDVNQNRLLIVDDNPDFADFIAYTGEKLGFATEASSNPDDSWEAYYTFSPTVLMVDLQMPKVDGMGLLKKLADFNCVSPIVLVSGLDAHVLEMAKRLGVSLGLNILGALEKPVMMMDMQTVLAPIMQNDIAIGEKRQVISENH